MKGPYMWGWNKCIFHMEGTGGIGGLLARSDGYSGGNGSCATHNYYHADGNGNVTYLAKSDQTVLALLDLLIDGVKDIPDILDDPDLFPKPTPIHVMPHPNIGAPKTGPIIRGPRQ